MSPGSARLGGFGIRCRDNGPYSAPIDRLRPASSTIFSAIIDGRQVLRQVCELLPNKWIFYVKVVGLQKKIFRVRFTAMKERADIDPSGAMLRSLDPLAELMLLDTRPKYPMGFFVECGGEGSLDRERLREAFNAVVARHPNAASHVVWRAGRPFWKPTTRPPTFLWDPNAAGTDPWRPFDLARETGLRLIVFPPRSSGELKKIWKLVLFGHHAVCDGLAACELLGEIWTHYADRPMPTLIQSEVPAPESNSTLPPVDSGVNQQKPIAKRLSSVLAEALRFLIFIPPALASDADTQKNNRLTDDASAETPASYFTDAEMKYQPPYRLLWFTSEQVNKFRKAAESRKVTLNTLILSASMRVFAEWNEEATGSSGGIRVTMPVNLRQDELRRPAENRIGYAFLDRSDADLKKEGTLIQTLSEASGWIKGSGAAGMFITAIDILRKIPGLLWLILRFPVCFSTAVVSNLGDSAKCMRTELFDSQGVQIGDDAVITHVVGVPPVRPRTAASLGIARYADRLYLACMTDGQTLGPAASERLLARIHAECLDLASKSQPNDVPGTSLSRHNASNSS